MTQDRPVKSGGQISHASLAMRIAEQLGFNRLAWSLRRLHCPVSKEALVLEVGSGGNPYARSNVLLDAYEVTRERHWVPLVTDRPTVLGFVENLPFRDKTFDFVIASHVLEHSADPARFLSELQRVAKAGYIETPDAFMERMNPYRDHRLEVTVRDGRLIIRKKPDWRTDPELVELYENRAKPWVTRELIPNHPFDFHVRYHWAGHIDYEVMNPDTDASWEPPLDQRQHCATSAESGIRRRFLKTIRAMLAQRERNRTLDLLPLLLCPTCTGNHLWREAEALTCEACGTVYPVKNGVPVLFPPSRHNRVR